MPAVYALLCALRLLSRCFPFFFNDTATTEIYTLSLHDALPISAPDPGLARLVVAAGRSERDGRRRHPVGDRKSTRLNSSHLGISYAVFCLKKKKKEESPQCVPRYHRSRDRSPFVVANGSLLAQR